MPIGNLLPCVEELRSTSPCDYRNLMGQLPQYETANRLSVALNPRLRSLWLTELPAYHPLAVGVVSELKFACHCLDQTFSDHFELGKFAFEL